ncbi:MAG: OmpA family protein [Deltaproteobacteria bacterium]|nr:OmpA family protein [Deltaproteobacteria bacterium]
MRRLAEAPPTRGTEVAGEDARVILLSLRRVHFPVDSSTLTEASREALAEVAGKLRDSRSLELVVQGHADERGATEYNLGLGERRSRTVADYLTRLGVEPSRLGIVSLGEEQPLAGGHDRESWAANRRVDFVLLRGDVQLVLEDGVRVTDDGRPLR